MLIDAEPWERSANSGRLVGKVEEVRAWRGPGFTSIGVGRVSGQDGLIPIASLIRSEVPLDALA